MNKRTFLILATGLPLFTLLQATSKQNKIIYKAADHIKKLDYDDEYWRDHLSSAEYAILRKGATEPRFSSKYTKFYQAGTYTCAGCDLPLFKSDMKYDSKTGWPSFSTHIRGHLETYTDLKDIWPKTGYRCAQCGGHHGHLIMDGPLPTGQRWCNNGQVLNFENA